MKISRNPWLKDTVSQNEGPVTYRIDGEASGALPVSCFEILENMTMRLTPFCFVSSATILGMFALIGCQQAESVTEEAVSTATSALSVQGSGDVDGDGNITATDSMMVAQYSVGTPVPSSFNQAVADVNCDSRIDIIDSQLIMKASVGLYDLEPQSGDVDADGVLTGTDAMAIANLSVGNVVPGDFNRCAADVTCDGRVDSVDGLMLLQALSGERVLHCWEPGDVDGDGKVTATDAMIVANYSVGKSVPHSFNRTLADVNCDKKVGIIDSMMITQASVGLRTLKPALGDVDADGAFTATDSMIIAQLSVGNSVPQNSNQCVADVNCDGSVNAVDQLLSAKASVGLIELHCWQPGDVDGDGIVTDVDARYIAMYASHVPGVPEHFIEPMADVDCNGTVDIFDSAATSSAVAAGTVPRCE